MIHYLVTRAHAYTMRTYLQTWQRDFLARVSLEHYEDLPYRRHRAGGTYIFSDLERVSAVQLSVAQAYCEQLRAGGGTILNEPRSVLRRYELLKLLAQKGINRFRAYRLNEPRENLRFPVFVRRENEHTGSLSPLVNNESDLQKALSDVVAAGHDARSLLIVEYCHTADAEGLFRKYSVMKIADRMVPRHVMFNRQWVDKDPTLIDQEKVAEEAEYLNSNPHEAALREVFAMANIDYGRIDYSLLDGKITVWEINTNPIILSAPAKCEPDRLPGQARSAKKIGEALGAIDTPTNGHVIKLRYDARLLQDAGVGFGWWVAGLADRFRVRV